MRPTSFNLVPSTTLQMLGTLGMLCVWVWYPSCPSRMFVVMVSYVCGNGLPLALSLACTLHKRLPCPHTSMRRRQATDTAHLARVVRQLLALGARPYALNVSPLAVAAPLHCLLCHLHSHAPLRCLLCHLHYNCELCTLLHCSSPLVDDSHLLS